MDDIKLLDKKNMFDIFYTLRDRIFMFNCIKIDLPKNANEFLKIYEIIIRPPLHYSIHLLILTITMSYLKQKH